MPNAISGIARLAAFRRSLGIGRFHPVDQKVDQVFQIGKAQTLTGLGVQQAKAPDFTP